MHVIFRLRMGDCGRSEKGNRVGMADGKGSSADRNGCEKVIDKGNADR